MTDITEKLETRVAKIIRQQIEIDLDSAKKLARSILEELSEGEIAHYENQWSYRQAEGQIN